MWDGVVVARGDLETKVRGGLQCYLEGKLEEDALKVAQEGGTRWRKVPRGEDELEVVMPGQGAMQGSRSSFLFVYLFICWAKHRRSPCLLFFNIYLLPSSCTVGLKIQKSYNFFFEDLVLFWIYIK